MSKASKNAIAFLLILTAGVSIYGMVKALSADPPLSPEVRRIKSEQLFWAQELCNKGDEQACQKAKRLTEELQSR